MENKFIKWDEINLKNKRSGTLKTTCPECSSSRKNPKDPCLFVSLNIGYAICYNCEKTSFRDSLDSRQKEIAVKYDLPPQNWHNFTNLSDTIVQYFETRKISQKTLEHFGITQEKVYQPQRGKEVVSIVFNYFEGDILVNKKFRSLKKEFTQSKNGKPIFYNINSIMGADEVYLTEGECFKGNTEVLTSKGWVSFDNYKGEDICQVDEYKKYSFVKPLNIIKKKYNDDLVKLSNSKNFEITTTKKHNIVVENSKGVLSKVKAIDIFLGKSNHKKIPRVCNGTNKEDYNISDNDLRLQVMFSADFTFRKEGDLYAGFKKERKVERVKMLLDNSEFDYSCNKVKNGYTSVFISRKFNTKRFSKLLNNEWLSLLSERQLKIILDETVYWDGNLVPNRNQIEYSSKEYHNITFIQTVAHLLGYMSTVIPRSNKFGSWYKASILFNKKHTSLQSSTKKELEKYNDFVYCVSVPTGMILVRQNNQISICGNCDVLSLYEIGIKNAISLPNGANDNDAFWINSEPYLKDIKKFYIATDMDEKGEMVAEKIAQRLGRYRCERVLFNGKDANDDLQNLELHITYKNTKKYPVSGTLTVNDLNSDIDYLFENGIPTTKRPKSMEFDSISEIFSTMDGQLTTVTGIPSSGKSNFTEWYLLNIIKDYDAKVSFFTPEHTPYSLFHAKMAEKTIGKPFFDRKYYEQGVSRMTNFELNAYKDWANERIYITSPDATQNPDWNFIFDTFEAQMMRYGVNIFVIDAYNKVVAKPNETHTQILTKITAFCSKHNVEVYLIAHPTKMQKDENNQYKIPTLYDCSGSADFRNQTHNGYIIHREYNADGNDRTLFVNGKTKFTFQGEIGKSVVIYYDKMNGRYYPENGVPNRKSLLDVDYGSRDYFKEEPKMIYEPTNIDFTTTTDDLPF